MRCVPCVSEPLHPKRYAGILLVCVAYIALCVHSYIRSLVFGQLMTGMVTLVQVSATVLQANCTVSQLEATVVG